MGTVRREVVRAVVIDLYITVIVVRCILHCSK